MKNSLKRFCAALLTLIFASICCVPFFAFAQTGTLGTEAPYVYATFKDGDDIVADGNELEAGRYTVDIHLKGMKSVSIFQITAVTNNITINSVSTIADVDNTFSCGAIVNENDSFVAVLATENDDTSVITDGAVMVTLDVTVSVAGDFANMFVISTDPDLTFVEADYGDGVEDAYVCTENEGMTYALMTYDMSPVLAPTTFSVNGSITVAESIDGTLGSVGIGGITVSVDGTDISAVTANDGSYTLSGLEKGTYTLSISGQTTIDRKITLVVDGDKSVEAVPVVICDYSRDTYVDNTDLLVFNNSYGSDKESELYNLYCDFNQDGFVDNTDALLFNTFYNSSIQYEEVIL